MPVTKITLSTAMRARDVARPHEEHLTEAAAREERATDPAETAPPKPIRKPDVEIPVPAPPRRRRRRRA